jgi:hypothetical protein
MRSGCGVLCLAHEVESEHTFLMDMGGERRRVKDEPGRHEVFINY